MNERRVLFQFGVVYSTDRSKLEQLPGKIRSIIEDIPDTRFDRAHFTKFGAYSIDFEVVYYIKSSDYNRYMDIQQRINLEILDFFKHEAIEFALPTYTIQRMKPTILENNH